MSDAARITEVTGRRVWDSRGRPTVEVDVHTASGTFGRAIAPAGASRGSGEAVELRDGGDRLGGRDVARAVAGVAAEIAPALRGADAADQATVDARLRALDGTADLSRLGGNTVVATSLAVAQAGAAAAGVPLWRHLRRLDGVADDAPVRMPHPEVQIIGGGAHAGRRIDLQDLMIVPVGAPDIATAFEWVAEVYSAAGTFLGGHGVADEGGWWPDVDTNEAALDLLTASIERAGLVPRTEVTIALDVASSEFGRDGAYTLGLEGRRFDRAAWQAQLLAWLERYPIGSIEDPFAEDDTVGMAAFTAAAGDRVQIVGDDFCVTDPQRVRAAVAADACNALLVKPNQVGTVTDAKAALDAARAGGWDVIVSARSGESEDVAIAHLAVAWGADQLKVGSFCRSERLAKWNECLRIAETVPSPVFAASARLR